ncbi:MAG: T9SS type A sorting domain-containing protein [Deltaproteobacteria bacterium]
MKNAFLTLIYLTICSSSYCQEMVVDSSFGNNGLLFFDNWLKNPYSFVIEPDIKKRMIIGSGNIYDTSGFLLTRYFTNGELDKTFGKNGEITLKASYPYPIVNVLKDNKILAAGRSYINNVQTIEITRFLENGTIDSTFGENGTSLIPAIDLQYTFLPSQILQQEDNKILLSGHCAYFAGGIAYNPRYLVILRINYNGSLDQTYGFKGYAVTNAFIQDENGIIAPSSSVLLKDNKISLAGYKDYIFNDTMSIVIRRYFKDGHQDTMYASNGEDIIIKDVKTRVVSHVSAKNNSTFTLINGGDANSSSWNSYLVKINQEGHLDSTFATKGIYKFSWHQNSNRIGRSLDLKIKDDGKIVIFGYKNFSDPIDLIAKDQYFLIQLDSLGQPDENFGLQGLEYWKDWNYNINLDAQRLKKISKIENDRITIFGFSNENHWPFFIRFKIDKSSQAEIEIYNENFNIFPNPTSGTFSLDLPADFNTENAVMTVYDLYGRVVMQKKVMETAESHDISNLGNGIYIIELRQNKKIFRNKLLITR